jgi:hypothetical protein
MHFSFTIKTEPNSTGANFTNILRATITHADPKSVKAAHKTIDEIDP